MSYIKGMQSGIQSCSSLFYNWDLTTVSTFEGDKQNQTGNLSSRDPWLKFNLCRVTNVIAYNTQQWTFNRDTKAAMIDDYHGDGLKR